MVESCLIWASKSDFDCRCGRGPSPWRPLPCTVHVTVAKQDWPLWVAIVRRAQRQRRANINYYSLQKSRAGCHKGGRQWKPKWSQRGCLSLWDVWFPPLDSRSSLPQRQRGCRQAHRTSSILHKDVIDSCLCTCCGPAGDGSGTSCQPAVASSL